MEASDEERARIALGEQRVAYAFLLQALRANKQRK